MNKNLATKVNAKIQSGYFILSLVLPIKNIAIPLKWVIAIVVFVILVINPAIQQALQTALSLIP